MLLVGLVAFLVVSVELARYLSAASAERDAVFQLLVDQARGDETAMLARLDGCAADGRCRAIVAANSRRLRRPGRPKILSYDSPTAYALGQRTGVARVAWADVSHNGLPVVQCVTVHRIWSFVDGASMSLRRISAPIDNEAGC